MTVDPRAPCLIGVAQLTNRTEATSASDEAEPLDMWARVAREAADDAGAASDVLGAVDSLQVVYCQSWPYDDPTHRLSERLGIDPRHTHYSGVGGTVPQQLVSDSAASILRGDVDVALICGGEALATKRLLKKAGERPAWSHREAERSPFPFEAPFHPAEIAHEIYQAWLTFPVFDIGRRAALGVAPDDYRRQIAELMAPMTSVAAENPYAWFPVVRSVAELETPTPENRYVGYPYTKYELAVMDVDMAAALVLTSHEKADELGVPPEKRVYLRGWSYATDPVYLAEHADFRRSPAMEATSSTALSAAGIGIDDVAHLDLYSCFGASINYALDALGLSAGDPRGVTVTGGLPFAGGPGSNYMLHSIATMTRELREDPGSYGLVSGVGMHMTKHTYAVYSSEPGEMNISDDEALQMELDRAIPPLPIVDTYEGPASVVTYTVAHGRDGGPEWGLAICDVPEGRCYARIADADLLAHVEEIEWVGTEVQIEAGDDNINFVRA